MQTESDRATHSDRDRGWQKEKQITVVKQLEF